MLSAPSSRVPERSHPRRVLRPALFSLFAMVLVLSACGGGTSDEVGAEVAVEAADAAQDGENAAAQADTDLDTSPSTESDTDEDSDESGEPETLQSLLGGASRFVTGQRGGQFDAEAVAEQQRQTQEAIRVCMANQGWEYNIDTTGQQGGRFAGVASLGSELGPEEYAAEYGFGLSTRFDALLDGGAAAFGQDDEELSANDEMLAAMSDGEADAWQLALQGERPERDEEGRLIDPETGEPLAGGQGRGGQQQGGCAGEAQTAVRGDVTQLQDLADEFEELNERIAADPRIAEITAAWSSCMFEAGYSFETLEEAETSIRVQLGPMVRELFGRGGPGGAQGDNADVGATGLSAEQEELLATLQDDERKLAVASFGCGGTDVEEIEEIRASYEAGFIEENRSLLESFSS